MEKYRGIDHDLGVLEYEYSDDWIKIKFNDGSVYEYMSGKAGQDNIEKMKQLADKGNGLNSFIYRNVRFKYSRKIR